MASQAGLYFLVASFLTSGEGTALERTQEDLSKRCLVSAWQKMHAQIYGCAPCGSGGLLVTWGQEPCVLVWDPVNPTTKRSLMGGVPVRSCSVLSAKQVVAGDVRGRVFTWNYATSEKTELFSEGSDQGQQVTAMAVSPKEKLGVVAFSGGQLVFWDLARKTEVKRSQSSQINTIGLSRDGKRMALAAETQMFRGELFVLETSSLSERWKNKGGLGYFSSIDFSATGDVVVAFQTDGHGSKLRFFDGDDGKELRNPITFQKESRRTQEIPAQTPPFVRVSPNGVLLALCSGDSLVQLWEVSTLRKACSLSGHAGPVSSLAFCSATRLITTGLYGEVRLWDIEKATAPPNVPKDAFDRINLSWENLKSLDPLLGIAATEFFCDHPKELMETIRQQKLILPTPSPAEVETLVQDLAAQAYSSREKAKRELIHHGELAERALRKALDSAKDLEVRKRIQEILPRISKVDGLGPHGHRLLRVIFLLERMPSADSRLLLERIEKASCEDVIKSRAKSALLRMTRSASSNRLRRGRDARLDGTRDAFRLVPQRQELR